MQMAAGGNVICALPRTDGDVGLVANQPQSLAGVLDIHPPEKAARFVQLCDAFNVPRVTLLHVPGFLPGVDQIVRGEPAADELVALTVVLMARAAEARRLSQPRFAHGDRRLRARWRRLERVTGYRNPVSWR